MIDRDAEDPPGPEPERPTRLTSAPAESKIRIERAGWSNAYIQTILADIELEHIGEE